MKKIALLLLVAAACVGAWFWLRVRHQSVSEPTDAAPVATVKVASVREGELAQTTRALGTVGSSVSGEHILGAPYDCTLRNVQVSEGARVAAGDVLCLIAPTPDAQLHLDSARATAAFAARALASARARFQLKLADNQEMLAAEQADSDAKLKLSSDEARGLGGNGMVRAPVGGIVGKWESRAGSIITAGSSLVAIIDEASLVVRLGIDASAAASVSVGQPVKLTVMHRSTLSADSSLSFVSSTVDPATGLREVWTALPTNTGLLPGEHVSVTIQLRKQKGMIVPRGAVLPQDNRQILFVIQSGKASKREIKLELSTETEVEVSGGNLHPGDQIAVLGNYELEDGMDVKVDSSVNSAPQNSEAGP